MHRLASVWYLDRAYLAHETSSVVAACIGPQRLKQLTTKTHLLLTDGHASLMHNVTGGGE